MTTNYIERESSVTVELYENDQEISHCTISFEKGSENIITITSWYTKPEYSNQGIGKISMKKAIEYCISKLGFPFLIKYIWNGQNDYIKIWMEKHFNAKMSCPLPVLKYNSDDDWESHIYVLDVESVLHYFHIMKPKVTISKREEVI